MWRGRVLLPWNRILLSLRRCVVDCDVFDDGVGAVVVYVIVEVR
jgi:hypothetical protein